VQLPFLTVIAFLESTGFDAAYAGPVKAVIPSDTKVIVQMIIRDISLLINRSILLSPCFLK
jgi:hypothetical protein